MEQTRKLVKERKESEKKNRLAKKELEILEAKTFDNLVKHGFDEKTALNIVTGQAEILPYCYLEGLRQKYGKGLV